MAMAVIMDAMAGVAIEQVCDKAEDIIRMSMKKYMENHILHGGTDTDTGIFRFRRKRQPCSFWKVKSGSESESATALSCFHEKP